MNIKVNQLANAVRFLSIDAVQKANSGHPGMPMGMADVATVLFKYHLRFNPKIRHGLIEIGLFYQLVTAQCYYTLCSISLVTKK